jgi:excinuclease ABC subunit A
METIRIRGARTHNLRNVSLDIPRNRLVVITGLSGSGKSSLAFDTLYAEGSAATSSRSRRTRASSCSSWRNPTST